MNTIDVIKRIKENNPEIKRFRFVTYEGQKDLASDYADSWTPSDDYIYNAALKLRAAYEIPFWNAIMISIINRENEPLPYNCLTGSCRHHNIREFKVIADDSIDNIADLVSSGLRIGINSKVWVGVRKSLHIPMLDFHISETQKNTKTVEEVCKILGVNGYILNSGKSYHFIGKKLFDKDAMINFLGRALTFTPIVDMTWIAHQLQDQSCTLRIVKKHGILPYVISEV